MTPENFAYWLQGFTEIAQTPPNDKQWQIIQDHLQEVFNKQTPLRIIAEKAATLVQPETRGVSLNDVRWPSAVRTIEVKEDGYVGTLNDGRRVIANGFNGFLSIDGSPSDTVSYC